MLICTDYLTSPSPGATTPDRRGLNSIKDEKWLIIKTATRRGGGGERTPEFNISPFYYALISLSVRIKISLRLHEVARGKHKNQLCESEGPISITGAGTTRTSAIRGLFIFARYTIRMNRGGRASEPLADKQVIGRLCKKK